MKLKTLNDLIIKANTTPDEDDEHIRDVVSVGILRAEAVKWVKDCQDKIFKRAEKGLKINRLEIWENIGKSNVLMDFFNLTEEDLK